MQKRPLPWTTVVTLPLPSIADNTADADRLIRGLKYHLDSHAVSIDLALLKQLPTRLRTLEYTVRCVLFKDRNCWILTDVVDPAPPSRVVGLAVDLGTTRIAIRLIDLASADPLAETSFTNPQVSIGVDILTRIHYSEKNEGMDTLNRLLLNDLNGQIAALCGSVGLQPDNIYAVSVAGNTAMTHFFMGLPPRWMIREPYIPVVNRPGVMKAAELGLSVYPLARVLIFSNAGSYVGGDLIAGTLFSGIHKQKDTAVLVDIGTNAEVIVGNRNWLIGCAGAAGPALEGGMSRIGMTAEPGVIDRVTLDPRTGDFLIHTIDDRTPKGICGSGIIDLAACLFRSGMIDIQGKLVPDRCEERYRVKDGIPHLVVVPAREASTDRSLCISQAEFDSLIRSKAAMYTILETITAAVELSIETISVFYIGGTFGSVIDPQSAITLGMLPDLPLNRYQCIGNSSLGGAALALTSDGVLDAMDDIRDRMTYFELNVNQDFMNRFSAARFIPHTDTRRFPSVSSSH